MSFDGFDDGVDGILGLTSALRGLRVSPSKPRTELNAGLRMILHPDTSASYTTIPDSSSTSSYLSLVKAHIRAEYACFIRSVSSAEQKIRPLAQAMDKHTFGGGEVMLTTGEPVDVEALSGHLMLFACTLYYARYSKTHGTVSFARGGSWPNSCNTHLGTESYSTLLDLGYAGEYVSELEACVAHESGEAPASSLLEAIANPARRQLVPWERPSMHSLTLSPVPINARQYELAAGMRYSVEGVQGPPGTGKSTLIYHLTESFVPTGSIVLCCAVQNKAIDSLAEKFSKSVEHTPFFVHGNEDRLGTLSKEWTAEAQAERDPLVLQKRKEWAAYFKVVRAAKEACAVATRLYPPAVLGGPLTPQHAAAQAEVDRARRHRQQLEDVYKSQIQIARKQCIARARVILCTISTASRSLLSDEELSTVSSNISVAILDEAGNCPEPKLPLLCLLPSLTRIIAVGDQNQLPPFTHISSRSGGSGKPLCKYVTSARGCRNGSRCSFSHDIYRRATTSASSTASAEPRGFFQRVESALPARAIGMLHDQYRMHPGIAKYISDTFYGGRLRTPESVSAARRAVDPRGLYWIPTSSAEEEGGSQGGRVIGYGTRSKGHGGHSKTNPGEAMLLVQAVTALRAARSKHRSKGIMVITFYKAQYKLLCEEFTAHGLEEVPEGTHGRPSLRITTVDQSQGSEADIVLVSCVRSNAEKEIGFLDKPNRVNVAMSRAREVLLVVGNPSTLCKDGPKGQWTQLRAAAERVAAVEMLLRDAEM